MVRIIGALSRPASRCKVIRLSLWFNQPFEIARNAQQSYPGSRWISSSSMSSQSVNPAHDAQNITRPVFGTSINPSTELQNDITLMMEAGLDCEAAQLFLQNSSFATSEMCLRLIKEYGNDRMCIYDKPISYDIKVDLQSRNSEPTMHEISLPLLLTLYHADRLSVLDIEHIFHIATLSGSINQSRQTYLMLERTGMFGFHPSFDPASIPSTISLSPKKSSRLRLSASLMHVQCWSINRMKRECTFRPSIELTDSLLNAAPSAGLFDWVDAFSRDDLLVVSNRVASFRAALMSHLQDIGDDVQSLLNKSNQPLGPMFDWQAPVLYLRSTPHSFRSDNAVPAQNRLTQPIGTFEWHPILQHQYERAQQFHIKGSLDDQPVGFLDSRAHEVLLQYQPETSTFRTTSSVVEKSTVQSAWDRVPMVDSLIIGSLMDLYDKSSMDDDLAYHSNSMSSIDLLLLHHLAFICTLPTLNQPDGPLVGSDVIDAMTSVVTRAGKRMKLNNTHLNLIMQAGFNMLSVSKSNNWPGGELRHLQLYERLLSTYEMLIQPVEQVLNSGALMQWKIDPNEDTYRFLVEITKLFEDSSDTSIRHSINRTRLIEWMREVQVAQRHRSSSASIVALPQPLTFLESVRLFMVAFLNRGDAVKQAEQSIVANAREREAYSAEKLPVYVPLALEDWARLVARAKLGDKDVCTQILHYHRQAWPQDHSIPSTGHNPHFSYHVDPHGDPSLTSHKQLDTWLLLFHCAAVKLDSDITFDLWAQYLQCCPNSSHVVCLGFMRAVLLAHLQTAIHSPPQSKRSSISSADLMRYIHFIPNLYHHWLSSTSMRSMLGMTFLLSHASPLLAPRHQIHITKPSPSCSEVVRREWRREARALLEMQAKYGPGQQARTQRQTALLQSQINGSEFVQRVMPSHARLMTSHERRLFHKWGIYMDTVIKAQQSAIVEADPRFWSEAADAVRTQLESQRTLLSKKATALLGLDHFVSDVIPFDGKKSQGDDTKEGKRNESQLRNVKSRATKSNQSKSTKSQDRGRAASDADLWDDEAVSADTDFLSFLDSSDLDDEPVQRKPTEELKDVDEWF